MEAHAWLACEAGHTKGSAGSPCRAGARRPFDSTIGRLLRRSIRTYPTTIPSAFDRAFQTSLRWCSPARDVSSQPTPAC
jgi:hypothetical protein